MNLPRLKIDLAACILLLAGMLIILSVLSHDAHRMGEPRSLYAAAETNFLGLPGAWVADSLFDTLGVAVYLFIVSWFVAVLMMFQRRSILRWIRRLSGWLILIPCAALAADHLGAIMPAKSLSGNGGSLGAWLTAIMEDSLPLTARWFLFGGCVLLGVCLSLDFAVLAVAKVLSIVIALIRPPCYAFLRFGAKAASFLWASFREFFKHGNRSNDTSAKKPPRGKFPRLAVIGAQETGGIPIHHHDQSQETLAAATPSSATAPPATASSATAPAPKQVPEPVPEPVPIRRLLAIPEKVNEFADYELPPLTILEEPAPFPYEEHDQHLRERAALLEKTFGDFDLNVRVVGINTGPVITQYEVALETGLRVHKVTGMSDDLALNLKVPSVRIVAPIPGKNTVGIEVPNEHRAVVRLKEVVLTAGKKVARAKIPLLLGKDTEGRPLVYDLSEMPHLLIAGRTGTGKSVCMNAIILSILMTRKPNEVKMIMIDPKMLELSEYGRIPHLMHPVVKDMKKAEAILSWAVDKMEERYDILSRARVRNIAAYNELPPEEIYQRVQPVDEEERKRVPERMPYIVIFVDEMNDLMMTMRKEVEGHIIRLAQKSRAAGIHLVVATQKPTVDVITGLIKSNLPARICFQVSSRSDSRVVLDEMGADKLLGKGDMLFLQPGTSTLIRAQGTYASDEEITCVVKHLECEPCYVQELVQLRTDGKDEEGGSFIDNLRARDDLYEPAIEVIIREGRGSVSLLQRALGIGYGRAARLIDFMAEDGIVGDYNGSQAREVRYNPEEWEQMKQSGALT